MSSTLCLLARRFVITLQSLPTEGTPRYIAIAIAYQPDSTERSPITFGFGSEHGPTQFHTVLYSPVQSHTVPYSAESVA